MNSTFMVVPKMGGTPQTLVTGQGNVVSMSLDADWIYWAESNLGNVGIIKRAPKTGGNPSVLANDTYGFALDASFIYYWTTAGNIERIGKSGGPPTTLASNVATANTPLVQIALGGGFIFWTDGATISRVPAAGGRMTTIANDSTGIATGLIADTTSVYWSDPVAGSVVRTALDGSQLTPIAMGLDAGPVYLASDDTNLFWSLYSQGPLQGSPVRKTTIGSWVTTTLCTGPIQGGNGGLAVDASYVYWTTQQGPHVLKTPK
jgi:hypothetical protein